MNRWMPYLVAVAAGLYCTVRLIPFAAEERGYMAIGGEWLVAPLFVLLVYTGSMLRSIIKEAIGYDGTDEN